MNAARWKQVNDLFHAALEHDPSGRDAFVASAAHNDPDLLKEVQSLLAAHDRGSDQFLESPAWGVAPELMFDDPGETLVGKVLGPYRILEEVGRGGMGVVYAAEDTRLGRHVAIKALTPEFTADHARRERLRREARAAASLSHPAIATIYALEELDGDLYIVSELVRGQTLREELQGGPLPPDRLRSTLLEIADALAAAHERGIVHRDLKPENVIRCVDGHVKVLDFGLARIAGRESDPTMTRLTKAGVAIGTPGYMAPEQMTGGVVDARTDVFAFGVLAAELATGGHPSTGAISGVWSVPELQPIIRRCVNTVPDERYRSGADIAAALRNATSKSEDGGARDAMWWWRFHQTSAAVFLAVMPAVAWWIRTWIGKPYGSWLFFVSLALATISVTLRLNLAFTSRVHPVLLPAQRRRVFPALPLVDAALAVLMIAAATRLAEAHDEVAGLLIGLGIVTLASVTLIEPATTRAAGIE
jgi:serine/threonine protein kinase